MPRREFSKLVFKDLILGTGFLVAQAYPKSHYVAKNPLKLLLLPPILKCWDYRHGPPHPGCAVPGTHSTAELHPSSALLIWDRIVPTGLELDLQLRMTFKLWFSYFHLPSAQIKSVFICWKVSIGKTVFHSGWQKQIKWKQHQEVHSRLFASFGITALLRWNSDILLLYNGVRRRHWPLLHNAQVSLWTKAI